MSAWFKIQLTIDCKKEKEVAVLKAAKEHWDFTDVTTGEVPDQDDYVRIYASGEGQSSYGGFDAVLTDIVHAIWRANGEYCDVGVQSLYLEELPWEDHTYNEEDHTEFMEREEAAEAT